MPFIGQEPLVGGYHVLDNITASATNTYNLLLGGVAFTPESANHLLVSLNGVIQKPGGAFSVSGSQITFIPSSGTSPFVEITTGALVIPPDNDKLPVICEPVACVLNF